MVCSACGFENQQGMRFCGMCGTPLPHRPLTAPGAHSTLNYTHLPVEAGTVSPERSTTFAAASHEEASREMPGAHREISTTTAVAPSPAEDLGDAVTPVSASAVEPPPKELVPDIPLDEYVQSFRYQPPSEPTEITMRGDAPVAEEGLGEKTTVGNAAESHATTAAQADHLPDEKPIAPATATAPGDTVEGRLGLEPVFVTESRAERPRFLDIGEPAPENSASTSQASTIVGPSFLGLSDSPPTESETAEIENEEAPRSSHWRGWLAAVVLLVFAGLGYMEWRSQVYQTDNGPVEIMKTKIRNWKHGSPSQASSGPAPAGPAGDTNAKPEMRVQEQPKPQPQNQNENSNDSATAPASPGAGKASRPEKVVASGEASNSKPTAALATPSTSQATSSAQGAGPTGQSAAATATEVAGSSANPPVKQPAPGSVKPKPARQAEASDDTAVKAAVPGAEELAKSRNASDSAAAAAWLWKSTAKGNPDAPVLLAEMYMKGDGVPRSCEQAVVLLKTAAEKENARARSRLASMYATGSCVPRNRVEAYRWLTSALAANPHSEWAQQNRDLIWQQMTPDERVMVEKSQ